MNNSDGVVFTTLPQQRQDEEMAFSAGNFRLPGARQILRATGK
ncbi:MAG TPA: hypothetical protein VI585_03350 [Candidatus Binatia bacterium]